MSDLKEGTGSRAPARDEDQDGTHGEEDNSRGTVSAALLYLYNSTFSCKWCQLLWQLFMGKRKFNQGTMRPWKFSQKCIYRRLSRSCGPVVLIQVWELFLFDFQTVRPRLTLQRFQRIHPQRSLYYAPRGTNRLPPTLRLRWRAWHFQIFDWLFIAAADWCLRGCVSERCQSHVWCQNRSVCCLGKSAVA